MVQDQVMIEEGFRILGLDSEKKRQECLKLTRFDETYGDLFPNDFEWTDTKNITEKENADAKLE